MYDTFDNQDNRDSYSNNSISSQDQDRAEIPVVVNSRVEVIQDEEDVEQNGDNIVAAHVEGVDDDPEAKLIIVLKVVEG